MMWKLIREDMESPPGNLPGSNITISHRLKVPGGWVLRTTVTAISSGGGVSVHHVFVKDPHHEWQIEPATD